MTAHNEISIMTIMLQLHGKLDQMHEYCKLLLVHCCSFFVCSSVCFLYTYHGLTKMYRLVISSFVALLLDPHNKKARYRLGQSLQGEGKIAKAYTEVKSLMQKYPEVKLQSIKEVRGKKPYLSDIYLT